MGSRPWQEENDACAITLNKKKSRPSPDENAQHLFAQQVSKVAKIAGEFSTAFPSPRRRCRTGRCRRPSQTPRSRPTSRRSELHSIFFAQETSAAGNLHTLRPNPATENLAEFSLVASRPEAKEKVATAIKLQSPGHPRFRQHREPATTRPHTHGS